MSSYTRQQRRGVPPLSQTWSRVVPDNFGYGKGKCTKQGPSGAHETHFGGDKLEDLEKANPFSFKEYLKTKNLSLSNEDITTSRIYLKEASRHPLGLKHSSPASKPMGYGLDYQQPFCEDPTRARNLSFFSNTSELAGPESLPPWKLSNTDSRISPVFPAGIPNADFAAHEDSLGDRHLRTLQMSYEALKDENSKLRRKLNEVQSFSETQREMVRTLEWKLEAKMIKEESDFHDLESAVQQVKQNLELMTKRTGIHGSMGFILSTKTAGLHSALAQDSRRNTGRSFFSAKQRSVKTGNPQALHS